MKLFRDRFLVVALIIYVIFWIALAIHPSDRGDWFLENLLIFISVAVLGITYGRFQFSNVSYVLILIFLAFHLRESPGRFLDAALAALEPQPLRSGHSLRVWLFAALSDDGIAHAFRSG